MPDLTQQIRERLDGLAPEVGDAERPMMFLEAPPSVSPEEVEVWQRKWDELFGDGAPGPMRILPATPRFYPGFEQMRDAILAVVEMHRRNSEDWTHISETAYEAGRRWALEQAVAEIAEKLGVEVDRG